MTRAVTGKVQVAMQMFSQVTVVAASSATKAAKNYSVFRINSSIISIPGRQRHLADDGVLTAPNA
jgi:hypothetical protein